MKFLAIFFYTLPYIALICTKTSIDFHYYHTTKVIAEDLNKLTQCGENGNIRITGIADISPKFKNNEEYVLLKYYDIWKTSNNTTKSNVFILGGEHPRELIAVEFTYNFIKYLCTDPEGNKLLDTNNFRVVVNANPNGREKVENGEYCTRTNLHNVDINRNWDIFWAKQNSDTGEENPGKKPFSEIETQFVLEAIRNYNPKMFLSIHSGVFGLYMPYAYLTEDAKVNRLNMVHALEEIKQKFCSSCQMGPPSLLIGYKSSGTCLDYIYEKLKVPYSFAWEIYSNEVPFPELENYKHGLQKKISIAHLRRNNNIKASIPKSNDENFIQYPVNYQYQQLPNGPIRYEYPYQNQYPFPYQNPYYSSFLLTSERNSLLYRSKKSYDDEDNETCLHLFNPLDKITYDFVLLNWTSALKHLISFVNSH